MGNRSARERLACWLVRLANRIYPGHPAVVVYTIERQEERERRRRVYGEYAIIGRPWKGSRFVGASVPDMMAVCSLTGLSDKAVADIAAGKEPAKPKSLQAILKEAGWYQAGDIVKRVRIRHLRGHRRLGQGYLKCGKRLGVRLIPLDYGGLNNALRPCKTCLREAANEILRS